MNIGIIGSGGREHSICLSLSYSKKIEKIFCFPGNAGTAEIAENQSLQLNAVEWLNQCSYNLRFQLRSALQSVVDQIDFDQFSEAGNRTSWVLSSKPCSQQEHKQI